MKTFKQTQTTLETTLSVMKTFKQTQQPLLNRQSVRKTSQSKLELFSLKDNCNHFSSSSVRVPFECVTLSTFDVLCTEKKTGLLDDLLRRMSE